MIRPLLLLPLIILDPGDGVALEPGLRAEYFAGADLAGEPAAVRVDADILFDWGKEPPDLRLAPGPFSARWTGSLLVQEEDEFRFSLHLAGAARVRLGGKTIVEGQRGESGWISGQRRRLEYGYHLLEVEFRQTATPARIGLYWESAEFVLEPLGGNRLFQPRGKTSGDDFERGLRLVRRLRCAACHDIPGIPRSSHAPALTTVAVSLERRHLLQKILSPRAALPGSRMPEFHLEQSEAGAVAAYLLEHSERGTDRGSTPKIDPKLSASGRRRILSRGCLACHSLGGIGAAARHASLPLDGAGGHRSAAALHLWLASPRAVDDRNVHRPDLALDTKERDEIVSFLAGTRDPASGQNAAAKLPSPDASDAAAGAAVLRARNCSACHDIPGKLASTSPAPALHRERPIDWKRSCLERGEGKVTRPHYLLDDEERAAIAAYLGRVSPHARNCRLEEGRLLVEEKGCHACHCRDGGPGLGEIVGALVAADPWWTGMEGSLSPPSITAAGDKLPDGVLGDMIRGKATRLRPWLDVRMPRFHHTDGEERAIRHFLTAHDRIPDRPTPHRTPLPEKSALFVAGHRLVGAGGFSCVSCHVVGPYTPPGVAPNVRGPDLARPGSRMRRQWFLRWMRDPTRMAPGIEMPAIAVAFPGVLDDDRDHQLLALWEALDSKNFSVPAHVATVREVRVRPNSRPRIIHDVFKMAPPFGTGWTPRALAIGFADGQSILLDMSIFAPLAWWQGGLARQFTEGKFWFWEPAGVPVIPRLPSFHSLALRDAKKLLLPVKVNQTTGWLDAWEHDGDSVTISYRLRFEGERWLHVCEGLSAASGDGDGAPGFVRRVNVTDLPEQYEAVYLLDVGKENEPRSKVNEVAIDSVSGPVVVSADTQEAWSLIEIRGAPRDGRLFAIPLVRVGAQTGISVRYVLRSGKTASTPAGAETLVETTTQATLDVVPGFEAIRLPLPRPLMPTAFAFGDDGAIFLTSLAGEVYRLGDRDGDGIEEVGEVIADSLASPFGILAEDDSLVVCHKSELLRLEDLDGNGRIDRSRVISTGWGFTENYHDWVVGIVGREGSYHMLVSSDYQQKGRPIETTMLRGKVVRIDEDGVAKPVARGLRFAIGIAANPDGEIFFTDNQGVNNTFNEINHLREGRRYGVPSLYDPAGDRKSPGELPAIQLPHPWTRSVNGITFLPRAERFGPFAGHGIGCEYDNRKLIRFTLQRVGDTYQGACYPFSRDVAGGGRLLGPISCATSPGGDLWIGNMKDSGWGGGNNFGDVVRMRPTGSVPLGIREVRATAHGFEIDWTGPGDTERAGRPENYSLSAYRRIWKGGYATPESDRHRVEVERVAVRKDRLGVRLDVSPLRAGFVFEIHVEKVGPGGAAPWPAEAYYTLNTIPE